MSRYTPKHRGQPKHNVTPTAIAATAATATLTLAAPTSTSDATASRSHHLIGQQHVHDAVQVVKAQKGDPYVYGAEGPNAFDCSGLMEYGFARVGAYLPRTADSQSHYVRRISAAQATRGDFVFYYSGSHVYHVAMVAGHHDGHTYVFEAPKPGGHVQHTMMWGAPHFYGSIRHAGWKKRWAKHHPHFHG